MIKETQTTALHKALMYRKYEAIVEEAKKLSKDDLHAKGFHFNRRLSIARKAIRIAKKA